MSFEKKEVKVRITKNEDIDIDNLEPFQGTLKTLSEVNYNKLRDVLIEEGFSFTVHVWQCDEITYIIDGHQRISVLRQMRKAGYDIPKIPCAFISARKFSDAKRLVLMAVSQYGKINLSGFEEFIDGEDFVFDNYDFPDFKIPSFKDEAEEPKTIEEPLPTEAECPRCGYEY